MLSPHSPRAAPPKPIPTPTPTECPLTLQFEPTEPRRAAIDQLPGPVVIEFGTPWCGYCRGAQPLIAEAFETHENVRHMKIEDGSGRPLGRSFRVKLWPTLIFMNHGLEVTRLVRPTAVSQIREALALIDNPPPA